MEFNCRCHIKKYITNDLSYKKIIDNIIDKYFKTIFENIIQFSNLKTCVYNIVPPVSMYNTWENPNEPYDGTDEERYVGLFKAV